MIRSFIFAPVLGALNRLEGKLMAALDDLTNEVTEATDVMESASTLISGLKQQLDEAIEKLNAGDNGEALNALSQQLDTSANALAAAVTANTPAGQGGDGTGGETPPVEEGARFTPAGGRLR